MIRVLHGHELPPNNLNCYFQQYIFFKLHKIKLRLEVVNDVLYQKFYNNVGNDTHTQVVVPAETKDEINKKRHNNTIQGNPSSTKMLLELRTR